MHLEILVEDQSGKTALETLIPKIIDDNHTCNIHAYKGIGRIPKGLKQSVDPKKRILLDRLPQLLRGYGRTFANYPPEYLAAVVLICDLDDRCLSLFRRELLGILCNCNPAPKARFCFAIEEGEAWYLGDLVAVRTAYPNARNAILNNYRNDSICGTWETLADAIYPGGAAALQQKGWQAIGNEKAVWANSITPYMEVDRNASASFGYFVAKIRELTEM